MTFQRHPLDANGKLLRRFYEPLILLNILDPTRGARRPDLIHDRGLDEQHKLWRDFLDHLCFICDFEKGGDTVTAVGAQSTVENTVFWLASNSKSRYKAKAHLQWTLSRLNCLHNATDTTVRYLEEQIFARCIEFGSRRIKADVGWLLRAVREMEQTLDKRGNPEDESLLRGLDIFETAATDYRKLCTLANRFRRDPLMEILSKRSNSDSSRNIWSNIRHYIGRLGAWTKAIRTLILGAQRFPQHIENAQVEIVLPKGPADMPFQETTIDIKKVIDRMLPKGSTKRAEELSQAVMETDAAFEVVEQFRNSYSKVTPRPHAELLVLEHFYDKSFGFVRGEKYIGCSKPSCYCCAIYMTCHPGSFEPRASHGNLWINWAPPIPLPLKVGNDQHGPIQRLQEHHTFRMLQEMIAIVRRDLQEQILSRRPKRTRLPDSTTGMSSVVYETATVHNVIAAFQAEPLPLPTSNFTGTPERMAHNTSETVDTDIAEDNTCMSHDSTDISDTSDSGAQGRAAKSIRKHNPSTKAVDLGRRQLANMNVGRPTQNTGTVLASVGTTIQSESDDDDDDHGEVLLFRGRIAVA